MDTNTMERRLAAAKDYAMLQGLMTIAVGVGVIVTALTGQGAFMAASVAIGAGGVGWYEKRYGKARQSSSSVVLAVVAALLIAGAVLVAAGFDAHRPLPILMTPLVGAIALGLGFYFGLRHVGMTTWHWVAIGLLALTMFAPLMGWRPATQAQALGLLGVPLIIIGIVDHLRLVSIFGGRQADDAEELR